MRHITFLIRSGLFSAFIFLTYKWIDWSDLTLFDSLPETPHVSSIIPGVRQSVTLHDGKFNYHLNLSRFEVEFPYLQTYQCSVICHPPVAPYDGSNFPLIIMAIKSHPGSGSKRSAIRQTWAKEQELKGHKIRRIFLVGKTKVSGEMELLKVENDMYRDILQWDMMEGHHNLSLKERCFIEWLYQNVPKVDYIFKGDDDEFVNTELVIDLIKDFGSPDIVHGFHQHRPTVMRKTKYSISKFLYPSNYYPGFVSGGGFIFSGASVPRLYNISCIIPVFPLDDVFFGFLALGANLTYRHDSRFHVEGLKYDVCRYKEAIIVHGISPDRLIKIWKEVNENKCGKEEKLKS